MARRNARPEPLSAIVLTFSNAAVAPCHARLNRPASGGGHLAPPNRRIRVACCIAIVSFRATAEATSAKASVSTTNRVAQLAMAAGHESRRAVANASDANDTKPHTRAVCSATSARQHRSTTRNTGASRIVGPRDARRSAAWKSEEGGTSERASVSARRPGARPRTKTPRTPVSSTRRSVHAATVREVDRSARVVRMTPTACTRSADDRL